MTATMIVIHITSRVGHRRRSRNRRDHLQFCVLGDQRRGGGHGVEVHITTMSGERRIRALLFWKRVLEGIGRISSIGKRRIETRVGVGLRNRGRTIRQRVRWQSRERRIKVTKHACLTRSRAKVIEGIMIFLLYEGFYLFDRKEGFIRSTILELLPLLV